MAKQTINIGTGEITGDGESIRSAFGKINNNFDEVYSDIATLDGSKIVYGDLSVTTASASGAGSLTYNSSTGVFTFTPAASVAETNDLTSAVTWANVPDANITESSVTQHQAALSITQSQISDLSHFDGAYSSLTGAPTAVSSFTNDSGYITGYTVTESDVTTHQAALSITESQISDLQSYLTSETTTSLSLAANTLSYTDETGTVTSIDLSPYLDEDSRAIASGTLNPSTGIVTFTRDDSSAFTLDLSALLDDGPVVSVAGRTGVVTLTADDLTDGSTNAIPTLTQESNWDTAYGWGDHSSAGYATASSTTTFTNKTIDDTVVIGDLTGLDTADNTAPTSFTIRAGNNTSGDLFNSAAGGSLTIQGGSAAASSSPGSVTINGGAGGGGGNIYLGTNNTVRVTVGTEMLFGDWDGVSNKDSAVFGDGLDLRIYHDGTDSWITDNNGSGILKIATSQLSVLGGNDGAETMATFVDNGAVTLYYDNNAKIVTTSAGVTVTGEVTTTGGNSTNWQTAYSWGDHSAENYVTSDTTGITGADQVTNIVSLTQAEYDAITPNASTVYFIVG